MNVGLEVFTEKILTDSGIDTSNMMPADIDRLLVFAFWPELVHACHKKFSDYPPPRLEHLQKVKINQPTTWVRTVQRSFSKVSEERWKKEDVPSIMVQLQEIFEGSVCPLWYIIAYYMSQSLGREKMIEYIPQLQDYAIKNGVQISTSLQLRQALFEFNQKNPSVDPKVILFLYGLIL